MARIRKNSSKQLNFTVFRNRRPVRDTVALLVAPAEVGRAMIQIRGIRLALIEEFEKFRLAGELKPMLQIAEAMTKLSNATVNIALYQARKGSRSITIDSDASPVQLDESGTKDWTKPEENTAIPEQNVG